MTKSEEKSIWKEFWDEFNHESPRGAVLITASFLDTQLQEILEKFIFHNLSAIRKIFEFGRSLNSFSAKIDFASGFDIFNEDIINDLRIMNKIRNKFAHEIFTANFEDSWIIDMCNNFRCGKIPFDHITESPENIFIISAVTLMTKVKFKALEFNRRYGDKPN